MDKNASAVIKKSKVAAYLMKSNIGKNWKESGYNCNIYTDINERETCYLL